MLSLRFVLGEFQPYGVTNGVTSTTHLKWRTLSPMCITLHNVAACISVPTAIGLSQQWSAHNVVFPPHHHPAAAPPGTSGTAFRRPCLDDYTVRCCRNTVASTGCRNWNSACLAAISRRRIDNPPHHHPAAAPSGRSGTAFRRPCQAATPSSPLPHRRPGRQPAFISAHQ